MKCNKCGYETNSDRMMNIHQFTEGQCVATVKPKEGIEQYFIGRGWYEYEGKKYRQKELVELLGVE